ncbi:glycoside hydrolase family 6 protein [Microbacterium sp. P06]|uniref:glycoside hydrolase family 6 protein n=1 Tax=Microbacterium sp. P06 TaxID=3366949 RepID=UPI003746E142
MVRKTSRPTTKRRRTKKILVIGVIALGTVALLALIAFVGINAQTFFQTLSARPPAVDTKIVAPNESKAALSAADPTGLSADEAAAVTYLAEQPTAYWITPELDPVDKVWDRIADLAVEAREQDAALAVVIYGLPGRDCGNFSAGGLDPDAYVEWTDLIGQALRNAQDVQKIVILEPDSLALAPECGNVAERVEQLSGAVDRLAGIDTWIYLDGGHSDWVPAAQMADLLTQVGVLDRVRGFATNVSNYQTTSDEFAYAHEVADLLGGDVHAIVDTSRNGAGPAGSDWCNPPGRLVGDPGGTYGDGVVDTNLWIKPPGESDGTCNGGPAAGVWWPDGAVELTREAR